MKNLFIFIISMGSILFSEIIMPEDGQQLSSIYVLFEWDQEPDAIEYNIRLGVTTTALLLRMYFVY